MVAYLCTGGGEESKTWRGRSPQRPQALPQQGDGVEGDQHDRYRHIQTSLVGQRCLGAAALVPWLFTANKGVEVWRDRLFPQTLSWPCPK